MSLQCLILIEYRRKQIVLYQIIHKTNFQVLLLTFQWKLYNQIKQIYKMKVDEYFIKQKG